MKRLLLLFIAIYILALPLAASADAIIEPDNSFYKRNSSQCVYLGRNFCVNTNGDYVSVRKEPDAGEISQIKNTEIIYVAYSCLYDGEYWGVTTYEGVPGGGKSGWVKMEQLLVLYDYISFEEEYFNEFYSYIGDFSEIKEAGAAIAWPWPGSGNALWTMNDLNAEAIHISHAYQDNQGREWGFVPYLYGNRNFWICITDPVNRDIETFNSETGPIRWETDTKHPEIKKTDNTMIVLITILVTLLVVGTAILIKGFWKPQKENTQSET